MCRSRQDLQRASAAGFSTQVRKCARATAKQVQVLSHTCFSTSLAPLSILVDTISATCGVCSAMLAAVPSMLADKSAAVCTRSSSGLSL